MGNSGSFRRGHPAHANAGRPKGHANKATKNAREAIARFLERNTSRLEGWLDEIAAKDGPRAAFACVVDLLEFHVPKLARTELTGHDGVPLAARIIHEHVTAPAALPAAKDEDGDTDA